MKKLVMDVNLFVSIGLFVISCILGFLGYIDVSLVFLIIASAFEVLFVKKQPLGYSSVTFIFVIFSIIYGLTGPITQQWLGGINEIYGSTFEIQDYILAFSLSEIGLMIGYTIYLSRHNAGEALERRKKIADFSLLSILQIVSPILMILGLIFQGINIMRLGGVDALFMGKASYQAAESALTFTLPAQIVAELSVASLSLYIGMSRFLKSNVKKLPLVLFVMALIPYLAVLMILGQRGKILYMAVVFFLGLTSFVPVKMINRKLLVLVPILYLFLVFIYTNRGIMPLFITDTDTFFSMITDSERYAKNLNPGDTEFSCAFGNFNKLIVSNDYELKYGKSYVDGLALLVPSLLYPGDKPQQITYEFRDKYFASEAKRSAIAGTAFSSILESYWNFGYLGIFFTYIIYGIILLYLDFSFAEKTAIKLLFVIAIAGSMVTFSRSQLGDELSNIFYIFVFMFFFVYIPYHVRMRRTINEKN